MIISCHGTVPQKQTNMYHCYYPWVVRENKTAGYHCQEEREEEEHGCILASKIKKTNKQQACKVRAKQWMDPQEQPFASVSSRKGSQQIMQFSGSVSMSTRKDSASGTWHGLSFICLRMAEILSCRSVFYLQGSWTFRSTSCSPIDRHSPVYYSLALLFCLPDWLPTNRCNDALSVVPVGLFIS